MFWEVEAKNVEAHDSCYRLSTGSGWRGFPPGALDA